MLYHVPELSLAALAGIASHLGLFIHGEWHLHVPEVLMAHGLIFAISCFLTTTARSIALSVVYLASLFTSISLYRLFFHRTRHFPGPRLAGLTKLWHVYQSRNSTNFLVLQKLHEQYGELVRTGPNEITVFRPDAVELLHGYKNTNTKDVWYDLLHPRKALVFSRDDEEMRAMKASWSQAVSSKCMSEYTLRILRLADEVVECIRAHGPGAPVLLNDVMSWFVFDAMGEITFGHGFDMLKRRSNEGDLMNIKQALSLLAPLNDATWLAHVGFRLFPWLGAVRGWWASVAFCEATMRRRMEVNFASEDCLNDLRLTINSQKLTKSTWPTSSLKSIKPPLHLLRIATTCLWETP